LRRGGGGARAFTLVEVLLVLALMGVLAGLAAMNAGVFIEASKYEPPSRVLAKAVMDSFYFASETKRITYLSYFEENATFFVSDASGGVLASHGIFDEDDLEDIQNDDLLPSVTFRTLGPQAGVQGGDSLYDEDVLSITRVPFHFGAGVPFQAEIKIAGEAEIEILEFDPFSGYPVQRVE